MAFCNVALAASLAIGVAATPAFAQLRAAPVASGLSRPVGFVVHPADASAFIVIEQAGRARVVRNGQIQTPDFVDLTSEIASGGEQGLLGIAFAPDYASSGRVFFYFTNRVGNPVVSRFQTAAGNPLRVDLATRLDLQWPNGDRFMTHPFSNHNGGHLAFGPDGFLYIGTGDGGSGNDPMNLSQNPLSLLGKFLRVDVGIPSSDTRGYRIPATNPFVGRSDVLGEIWSLGLRNPWRWSFDDVAKGGTGALVVGDVGQGAWEEVNYEPPGSGGRNYGWRNREGAHNNVTSQAPFSTPLRDPIFEYNHATGSSITGGFVYRGRALGSSYVGRYFFGDFVSSRVWSVALTVNPSTGEATASNVIEHTSDLGSAAASPASFGVDANGEIYVVSYNGTISRIESVTPAGGRARSGAIVGTARPR
jgi:glucose/arabinose dehydrogenase